MERKIHCPESTNDKYLQTVRELFRPHVEKEGTSVYSSRKDKYIRRSLWKKIISEKQVRMRMKW